MESRLRTSLHYRSQLIIRPLSKLTFYILNNIIKFMLGANINIKRMTKKREQRQYSPVPVFQIIYSVGTTSAHLYSYLGPNGRLMMPSILGSMSCERPF